MASAGTYASLHLAADRQPRQHPTTQFFTGRMPFLPSNQQRQSTEGNGDHEMSYYSFFVWICRIHSSAAVHWHMDKSRSENKSFQCPTTEGLLTFLQYAFMLMMEKTALFLHKVTFSNDFYQVLAITCACYCLITCIFLEEPRAICWYTVPMHCSLQSIEVCALLTKKKTSQAKDNTHALYGHFSDKSCAVG